MQEKQNSCAHDSGTPIFVLWVDLRQMAQAEEGGDDMACTKLTNHALHSHFARLVLSLYEVLPTVLVFSTICVRDIIQSLTC